MEAPDGWLWLETPGRRLKGQTIEAWLEGLIDGGYIRATYVMISASTARVRMYVLPEELRKELIKNEMDNTMRRNLKKLIQSTDVSIEGWKGQLGHNPTKISVGSAMKELISPTQEIYSLDAREMKFFKDPTYPDMARKTRYGLRQNMNGRKFQNHQL